MDNDRVIEKMYELSHIFIFFYLFQFGVNSICIYLMIFVPLVSTAGDALCVGCVV